MAKTKNKSMEEIIKGNEKIDATRRHLFKDDGAKRPGMSNADWVSYNKSCEMKHVKFANRPPVKSND